MIADKKMFIRKVCRTLFDKVCVVFDVEKQVFFLRNGYPSDSVDYVDTLIINPQLLVKWLNDGESRVINTYCDILVDIRNGAMGESDILFVPIKVNEDYSYIPEFRNAIPWSDIR